VTIYLPIAELSVNVFVILGMGAAVGFLSGMFGVGGGFLITPLLIFYNIPPAVAVATGANQVVASSISGALAHFKRGSLDIKLGLVLLIGGLGGATIGIQIFTLLRRSGAARSDHLVALRDLSRIGRRTDAVGERQLHASRSEEQSGSFAQARPAWLGARPADQDALQALEDLCQHLSGDRSGRLNRHPHCPSWALAAASSWSRR
jgi:hypothetical protein